MFGTILAATIFLQAIIIEFGGSFTATSPLPVGQWFSCIGIAAISLPLGAVIRMIPLPKAASERESDKANAHFASGLLEETVEME
jgi:Ca2+-transporting ATPase